VARKLVVGLAAVMVALVPGTAYADFGSDYHDPVSAERPLVRPDTPHCRAKRPPAADTKSRAGRRAIGLPDELVMLPRMQRAEQEAERRAARQLWQDQDWCSPRRPGRPSTRSPTTGTGSGC
jgi:hypothetical protein